MPPQIFSPSVIVERAEGSVTGEEFGFSDILYILYQYSMALPSPEILDLEDDDLFLQADDYPSESPPKSTLVNQPDPDTGIASTINTLPNA